MKPQFTEISKATSDGRVYLHPRGTWVNEPVCLPEQFGGIYGGKNPTHGVYSAASLEQWGPAAQAISHHWSEQAAAEACSRETKSRGYVCIVVQFEDIF